jgi:hypothetical protein
VHKKKLSRALSLCSGFHAPTRRRLRKPATHVGLADARPAVAGRVVPIGC